jgi:peptidoglycan hydrolase-like protein with peptidoglycan-binding domain
MKRTALLFLLALALPALRADDLTKNVQTELKELGFFYAEVNGNAGPETTAAIRRFQIRNGYEVTGTLTKETLKGLGLGDDEAPAPAPAPTKAPPAPAPAPAETDEPIHLRRDETVQESDRNFLRQESARQRTTRDPSTVSPPAPLNPPPDPGRQDFSHIFAHTPYESAPPEVQVSTVRRAQSLLARAGFYRSAIDGDPGPATEEALLRYQRRQNLVMTGRLDLETLSTMSLLPTRTADKTTRPFTVPRGSRYAPRVLRGIWID